VSRWPIVNRLEAVSSRLRKKVKEKRKEEEEKKKKKRKKGRIY